MQFNSYIFILVFLPVFVTSYFALNRIRAGLDFGKLLLIIGSAAFYMYGGWRGSIVLGISIIMNYILAVTISKFPKKLFLFIDIICNICILFYFKYCNFLVTNINIFFRKDIAIKDFILPLSISFFTFQQIMYIVNIYQKKINLNLFDYLAYILYFPKILMGPLNEPENFISQLNDNRLKQMDWKNISCGIKIFSFGLFKKMVLADTFARAVNWGYSNFEAATSIDWILITVSYTFEIYFDFSGYTDMAAGVSSMLNIQLPINFDSPYKAVSIRDFWKRWHISLTAFFTKYIYIPLGGSKKGPLRTYLNTMLVFLISGIWHGANWTFLLWGILHGTFSIFNRLLEKQEEKLHKAVRWSATFFIINILWLLFRSDSIIQWASILEKIFTFQNMAVSDGLIQSFILPETAFIFNILHLNAVNSIVRGFSMLLFILSSYTLCLIPENNSRNFYLNNGVTLLLSITAFIWGFLCLSSESVFVYFNF